MASYSVTYVCGHTGSVELYGKNTDRQNKLKWYTTVVCSECYKAQKHAEEDARPLTCVIDCEPFEQIVVLHFEGGTMPYKEAIQALGYRWTNDYAIGTFGLLATTAPPKRWVKTILINDLDLEREKVKSIGAHIENHISDIDASAFKMILAEKAAKIAAIPKPIVPEVIKGHSFNGKVYGSLFNFSIYLDGERTEITDAEAEEIIKYVKEKEIYKDAVSKIK